MSEYSDLKDKLVLVLGSHLGEYRLANNALVPSISIGDPVAKMATPGIEAIIEQPFASVPTMLLNRETQTLHRFKVSLDLWTPELLGVDAPPLVIGSASDVVDLIYTSSQFDSIQSIGTRPATRTSPGRTSLYVAYFYKFS